MTREEAYLTVVEGWLRNNRGIVFTEGAVDDLCDRIVAEIKRLTSERNDYEAEGRRHIKTIAELRHEKERLYINVADRDKELARWQHDALGWSDKLTAATDENERLNKVNATLCNCYADIKTEMDRLLEMLAEAKGETL